MRPTDGIKPSLAKRMLDLASGTLIVTLCLLAGEGLASLTARIGLPVPGSVLGMLLLFLALLCGLVKLPAVESLAGLLLEYLGLFFVPAGVGLMACLGELKASWVSIALATVASTLLVLTLTARVAQTLEKGPKHHDT